LKTYKEKEMVDFRRMIPVLAVLAFLLGSAVTASAQGPLQCIPNGGVSVPSRAEGITELTGDIVLICTGGTVTAAGAQIPQVNIQVFLNTSLTSRLLTTSSTSTQWSEALLLLDEPLPANQFPCSNVSALISTPPGLAGGGGPNSVCAGTGNGLGAGYYGGNALPTLVNGVYTSTPNANRNVFEAVQNTSNSVTFVGIPIDPPGTTGSRIVRITNIRGNANGLGVAAANSSPLGIIATLSPTPAQFLPISGSASVTVAIVQKSLVTGIFTTGTGSTLESVNTLQQCNNNRAISTGTAFNTAIGFLSYTELFASAFKVRILGDNDTSSNRSSPTPNPAPANLLSGHQDNLTLGTFNTESGFVNPTLNLPSGTNGQNTATPAGTAGLADWGTRFKAVFNNIPNGVAIFVDATGTTSGGAPDVARLTANETGTYSGVSGSGSNPNGSAQLTVTNGSATAIWEDLVSDPNTFATIRFGFYVTYTASPGTNSPALATATVNMSYAPTSTVTSAANANVPRFADTSTATNIFTVVPCLTTLLFPFVTNQSGFDTGIAISATATDPFGTTPQSGTCTLNWYGAAFTGATPTPTINSGTTYALLVSTTLNNVTGGFQGYMIAVCRFQYAHGFAFISDLGARNLAMGYLALVIPDPTSSSSGRLAIPAPCGGANDTSGPLAGCLSTGENLSN
jgi:hypothetical protein